MLSNTLFSPNLKYLCVYRHLIFKEYKIGKSIELIVEWWSPEDGGKEVRGDIVQWYEVTVWRRQPFPVFLPGKFRGQRRLAGHSPWGRTESAINWVTKHMKLQLHKGCCLVPFPSPGDLAHPGTEPASLASPALAGGFFSAEPSGKPLHKRSSKDLLYNTCL